MAAALRETHEEIGLAPEHVTALGSLPDALVPVSRFVVTPVLAWADAADDLTVIEPGEVLHTLRIPVGAMLAPESRASVTIAGHRSAGFQLATGWVWGFTGNLLDHVFSELGWTRPWDVTRRYAMTPAEARGAALDAPLDAPLVPPADGD